MDNIADGFKLMAIGMGMVFVFISLMVCVINATAKVLAPYAHLLVEPVSAARSGSAEPQSGVAQVQNDLLAAVVAAVHKHRARR